MQNSRVHESPMTTKHRVDRANWATTLRTLHVSRRELWQFNYRGQQISHPQFDIYTVGARIVCVVQDFTSEQGPAGNSSEPEHDAYICRVGRLIDPSEDGAAVGFVCRK